LPRLTIRGFLIFWLPAMIMLGIVAAESSDRFSGAHTLGMLRSLLAWFSLHPNLRAIAKANEILRKCGHVLGYGLLSFLFFRACRGTSRALAGYYDWRTSRVTKLPVPHAFHFLWQLRWALLALGATALAATADELHQMTIASRNGSWWDVLLDSCAGLFAQILIFRFAVRNALRAKRAQPAPSAVTHMRE
jgi:VanZ family protein